MQARITKSSPSAVWKIRKAFSKIPQRSHRARTLNKGGRKICDFGQ